MGKDCNSEDDFESDEERITNGQKSLITSFERAMKDFVRPSKGSRMNLENLQLKPFPAELQPCLEESKTTNQSVPNSTIHT